MQAYGTDVGGVKVRTVQCHSTVSVYVCDPPADVKPGAIEGSAVNLGLKRPGVCLAYSTRKKHMLKILCFFENAFLLLNFM
jgi:hypothetical protein